MELGGRGCLSPLGHVPYAGQGAEGLDVSHSWFQSCFDLIFPCFLLIASFLDGNAYSVPLYSGICNVFFFLILQGFMVKSLLKSQKRLRT